MPARLLHVWGPLWVQSYGVMILLALLTTLPFAMRELEKRRLLSREVFWSGVSGAIFIGILGGRIMHFLYSPAELLAYPLSFFFVWDGGLSLLGAVMTIPPFGLWYAYKHGAPVFKVADIIICAAPAAQAIARFGCFFAGCCYGLPAIDLPWAITYSDPTCLAPCGIALHPAQLYASAASFLVFLILFLMYRFGWASRPGVIFGAYFFFEGIARCMVEFWRDDYLVDSYWLGIFTSYQVLSLCIALVGGVFALSRLLCRGKMNV